MRNPQKRGIFLSLTCPVFSDGVSLIAGIPFLSDGRKKGGKKDRPALMPFEFACKSEKEYARNENAVTRYARTTAFFKFRGENICDAKK